MTSGEHPRGDSAQGPTAPIEQVLSKEKIGETAVEAVTLFVEAQKLDGEREKASRNLNHWEDEKGGAEAAEKKAGGDLSILEGYQRETKGAFTQLEDTLDNHLHFALFALESQLLQTSRNLQTEAESRDRAGKDLKLLSDKLFVTMKNGGQHWDTETGDKPERYINLDEELQDLFRRAIKAGIEEKQASLEASLQNLEDLGDGVELNEKVEKLQAKVSQLTDEATQAVEQLNGWEERLWLEQVRRPFAGTEDDFMTLYGLRQDLYWEALREAPRGKSFGSLEPGLRAKEEKITLFDHRIKTDDKLSEIYVWLTVDVLRRQVLFLRPPEGFKLSLVTQGVPDGTQERYTLDHLAILRWSPSGNVER